MSRMGEYLLDIQEIVDPMVYMGHTDESIIKEVKKRLPDTPESWITETINMSLREQEGYE